MLGKLKKALLVMPSMLIWAVSTPVVFAAAGVGPDGMGVQTKGLDLSSLTNSVNFSAVLTAIMAVASSLIVLYGGSAGVRWILRMVRGA